MIQFCVRAVLESTDRRRPRQEFRPITLRLPPRPAVPSFSRMFRRANDAFNRRNTTLDGVWWIAPPTPEKALNVETGAKPVVDRREGYSRYSSRCSRIRLLQPSLAELNDISDLCRDADLKRLEALL